jgi:hypothetical protein
MGLFSKSPEEKVNIAVVLAACGCGADRGYGCPRCGRCFCNAPCGCSRS